MESQRIVYMEESHHCRHCGKLVCRIERGNGSRDHTDCGCEITEILDLLNFGVEKG